MPQPCYPLTSRGVITQLTHTGGHDIDRCDASGLFTMVRHRLATVEKRTVMTLEDIERVNVKEEKNA